jgi:hypothetical protein
MATKRKEIKNTKTEEPEMNSLWRKPIVLDDETIDDPLETFYRGKEVNKPEVKTKRNVKSKSEKEPADIAAKTENLSTQSTTHLTEAELKAILKIKSDAFIFTDIREILRGKSLEIYTYLRYLAGETGVCKIKHLDLMRILDISRPTLFKQGDWLTKLSLIEKRNVPGDHFGTSYIVHRLENVLPVSEKLIEQLQTQIDSYRQTSG